MDLKVVYGILTEVLALEERLAAARDARARHTRRDDHLGALGRELAADALVARLAVDEANAVLRRLDRELREVELGIASRQERLTAVADTRQAVAVRLEVEGLEKRKQSLEAEALGLLGALEAAEAAVDEAESDAGRQSARSRSELSGLAEAAERGAAALAAGEQEMVRLLGLLPDDLARHLRRLQARGDQSVAPVRSGACGGCFGQLPAVLVGEVERRRSLVRCPGCGRAVI